MQIFIHDHVPDSYWTWVRDAVVVYPCCEDNPVGGHDDAYHHFVWMVTCHGCQARAHRRCTTLTRGKYLCAACHDGDD
jgi:hypothetical protein